MRTAALSLTLLVLSACGSDYDTDAGAPEAPPAEALGEAEDSAGADVGFSDPIRGEIAALEQSADGKVEVGVTDEVVFFRFTKKAQAKAQEGFEAESGDDSIDEMVKGLAGGVIAKALASTVQLPHEDVQALRYESGRLIIDGEGDGPTFSFEEEGETNSGMAFDEAAAKRLIRAFEAQR
ncbi:hypothetical protein [Rubricoccus marinus]|uniref:Uncharacterized protein n=1 Tax=Rubricoccus marinus TaxID=716817 RepID=A0A259TYP5_9BACT|nr:hypothetical protein [Rubricoccus marinus]OZC02816.1 hypothetical protein BSZ36_07420 [Rubricoccus marinus]